MQRPEKKTAGCDTGKIENMNSAVWEFIFCCFLQVPVSFKKRNYFYMLHHRQKVYSLTTLEVKSLHYRILYMDHCASSENNAPALDESVKWLVEINIKSKSHESRISGKRNCHISFQ